MRKPVVCALLLALLVLVLNTTAWAAPATDHADTLSEVQLAQWLASPAMPGGFVGQLGWGDGQPALRLAALGNWSIHVLEPDAARVAQARETLRAANLLGVVTVEWWPESFLPYPENTINVLLVNEPGRISTPEMARVTTPLGAFCLAEGKGWRRVIKPWPVEFDQWTHWRHGADGNMVSRDSAIKTPTGVRWIAGPAQDPGGRKWYYDHVLVSANGRNFYMYEDFIVARDAFNGRLLWTREAKAYSFQESGSPIFLKLGVRPSKVRPVAQGDRLYLAVDGQLSALEGSSGKALQNFDAVNAPREIMATDHRVIMSDTNSIRAYTTSGDKVWEIPEAPKRMVAGEGRLVYLVGNEIAGADAATGAPRWRTAHELAGQAVTITMGKGVVVLERSSWKDDAPGNGLLVFSADTGALLWEKEYTPGMTHYKEARSFFMDNLLWIQGNRQKILGLDPLTGKEQKQFVSRGLHCAAPLATENFFIAPEVEFTNLKTGERDRARMVKSACRLPFVPANGLLYTFPVQCECFPMLRGYMGLAQAPVMRTPDAPRLQKGPAFKAAASPPATDDEWPMYRRDRYRSNYQPTPLGSGTPRVLWETALATGLTNQLADDWEDNPFTPGLLTPPVCAGQTVLVAAPDTHQIIALDAASGAVRWTYTTGGRLDGPPSVWQGYCVVGAHDGYVYCLRLADGQLAWRLRAAPQSDVMPAYGQLESVWPVGGGVLIENGIAFLAAGRHPASDGGVRVLAVNIADGAVRWEKNVTDSGVKDWYSGMLPGTNQKIGVDYEPVDLLVRDGAKVAMSRWQFDPLNGQLTLSHTNTNYVAFASLKVPRGVWGYGIRQNKTVLPKTPAAFTSEKVLRGTTNEVALVLAGAVAVRANQAAELSVGQQTLKLGAPLVRDGLALAYGRIYASARNGRVYCVQLND